MSPSDTGSKEGRPLLLLFDLVREIGIDCCSSNLIFIILLLTQCPKVLAKSTGLM